ncbi:general substrate transporter [Aspergillus undulatus]|uniref:general substrate transporter n=1 Tax=Aspergillus undulatus TaxID=1810928 RepID=UPI003CCCDC29
MLLTQALFALSGVPICTGAALSFFINGRVGPRWSFRIYALIWIIGQLIAVGAQGNIVTMYAARIIVGFGIGPLTAIGPIALVEIAPAEIRGLLTSWFSVAMLMSLFVAAFTVYGCFVHMASSTLQWQIPFFTVALFMALAILASFFIYESPRWLFLAGRDEEATETLVLLRGLPFGSPRVQSELEEIRASIVKERAAFGSASTYSLKGLRAVLKETFLVKANLRRTQQASISYALAQLSGANSITAYLVPVLGMVGIKGDTAYSLFVTGMYSMSKFFTLIASFFFVEAIGRRNSLFLGITVQMISDTYIASLSRKAAIAAIFIHGFGYAMGLLILPYIFVSELWPKQIRSSGAALITDNWGAFHFFAGWCALALVYVFYIVPETAGVPLEQLDELFKGPIVSILYLSNPTHQTQKND